MFCPNCGTQIDENGAFCPNCGSQLNSVDTPTPAAPVAEKPKKKKGAKILLIICSFVLVVAIVLGGLWFLNGKDNGKDNDDPSTPSTETSQEENDEDTIKYIDYYSNTDKWTGEYGFSDLTDFSYYKNGSYCEVADSHLGVISAYQYDTNNDMNNELITVSLLPYGTENLYISVDMYSNTKEIEKISSLKVDSYFDSSELPFLSLGNTDLQTGSYFTVLAFIEGDKLCIMHDVYASAEIGRPETYSNFYIYNISDTGLSLYKHFYCKEFEYKDNIRKCVIGEQVERNSVVVDIDYNYSTDSFIKEWDEAKKSEVARMRTSIFHTGLDKYLATDDELERLDWISTTAIFEEDYFEKTTTTCEPIMQLWFTNSDDRNDYRSDGIVDHTNIRMRLTND